MKAPRSTVECHAECQRESLDATLLLGTGLIVCLIACVPLTVGALEAGGIVAGGGSVGAAGAVFCGTACPAAFEVGVAGCAIAGACFGPEVGLSPDSAGFGGLADIALDYSTFPVEGLAPTGPLQLVDGGAYAAARAAANQANRQIRLDAGRAGFDPTGYDVHEIQPVKWGGNPVDPANKVLLPSQLHIEVTSWWNAQMRAFLGVN